MRTLATPVLAVAAAIAALLLYSSVFVVTEREQALVLRFGVITRQITDPGLYFKLPTGFVDQVLYVDKRLLVLEQNDKVVQVADGRRYVVDSFATFRIADARTFREAVSANLDLASARLSTRLDAAMRQVYGRRNFEAALSVARDDMMREVSDLVKPEAVKLGMDLVDVHIRRTDLVPEVSQQTYDRMRAERLAEAAELRAQGTEQSLAIRADADRQATVLVAEAQRDADILHGQGDAERARILASAYGKDADFFAFYNSLTAYKQALGKNNTTLVLSPQSDFFRYLGSASGKPAGQ